jgi:hypothetical protein
VIAQNGNGRAEVPGTAVVAAAERMAAAVIVAFDSCDCLGVPLSDLQKIAVIEALLLEFDGFSAQLGSIERISGMLRAAGATRP